jgi:hypothetical protein
VDYVTQKVMPTPAHGLILGAPGWRATRAVRRDSPNSPDSLGMNLIESLRVKGLALALKVGRQLGVADLALNLWR